MPRLVAIAALLAWVLATAPALAQRPASCQAERNRPSINVTTHMDVQPLKLDRTLSREQLIAFHPVAAGTRTLGLTTYRLELLQNVKFAFRKVATGVCFWVEAVDVTVRYPSMDVYIAKEYAPGSCAYRAVLAHENKHADIARAHVERYTPKFGLALETLMIPTARAPMAAATVEEGKAQVEADIRRLLKPQHDQMTAEMNRAQAAIDTPESYAQVKRQCTDW